MTEILLKVVLNTIHNLYGLENLFLKEHVEEQNKRSYGITCICNIEKNVSNCHHPSLNFSYFKLILQNFYFMFNFKTKCRGKGGIG